MSVLAGHKRVGKRFVAPLNQIGGITETSYVNRTIPELLWMEMVNSSYGYREGIRLVSDLATSVLNAIGSSPFRNFAVCSRYGEVSQEARDEIKDKLIEQDLGCMLSSALGPLVRTYPEFPMSWLLNCEEEGVGDVEKIKSAIERVFDKYVLPASVIQASVMYIRGIGGALHIASHIEAPDFNAMIETPESEAGKRAASHARIGAMMDIMSSDLPENWPRHFWGRNYEITCCENGQ